MPKRRVCPFNFRPLEVIRRDEYGPPRYWTRIVERTLKPDGVVPGGAAALAAASVPQTFAVGDAIYLGVSSGKPDVAVITHIIAWEDDDRLDSNIRGSVHVTVRPFVRPERLAQATAKGMTGLVRDVSSGRCCP